jgi:hypothetical protein
MEHTQTTLAQPDLYQYRPNESETEKASNCYLMSVVAVIAGMPVPIINLLATVIFFFANRKATYYVRWHCTQALLSQLTIFCINTVGFSWTMGIIFGNLVITDKYLAYICVLVAVNILELIINIATAVSTRKGKHSEWWFWGSLTNALVINRPDKIK